MNTLCAGIKQRLYANKKRLLYCLAVTFIFGLAAHAYMYFQDAFSNDSLNEFNGQQYIHWKIQLGRFLAPVCRLFTRGDLTLPWLIGLISLFWTSMVVFVTTKIFEVKSKTLTALIAGIFVTNITVTATTATYIHDLDVNMLALLLAVISVYLWQRHKWGHLFGAIFVFGALALYQSYISVTITLIFIDLILRLLKQTDFKTVFIKGLKAILMLAIAGAAYYATYKVTLLLFNLNTVTSYNSMENLLNLEFFELIKDIVRTYVLTIRFILLAPSSLPAFATAAISILCILTAGVIILAKIFSKEIGIKEKLLTLVLIALLPMAMNISKVLSNGMSHDLMHYAIWLVYLFVLLILYNADTLAPNKNSFISLIGKYGKQLCALLLCIMFLGNIVLANQVYVKKDLEQEATLAYFTRVIDRMDTTEGYTRTETPVVFIGQPDYLTDNMEGFETPGLLIGATYHYVLGAAQPDYYDSYFAYKLHYKILVADNFEDFLDNQAVLDMPVFPQQGSIQIIDGTLVVKLGNPNE